jgi:hypothetical protein
MVPCPWTACCQGAIPPGLNAGPPALHARGRFLDHVLTGPAAELALAGREPEATAAFAAALDQAEETPAALIERGGSRRSACCVAASPRW